MEELLTVKEVAAALGIGEIQVRRYHKSGLLPFVENGPRGRGVQRLTRAADVRSFQRPKRGPKGPHKNQSVGGTQ